jgi:4-hydroxybenzoate polyprenyltransferase
MAVPYLVFFISSNCAINPIYAVLCSITVIIGVAGIGYLTNDLGDRKKDAIIQKENATSELSVWSICFLFMVFGLFMLAPWVYLPFNKISAGLLVLQIALFVMYAFPPFRFKEKGLLGVVTDALYAHVNPAVLAGYTFFQLTSTPWSTFVWFIGLLSAWQLVLGLRNILFHQLKDVTNDLNSNTKTFVTFYGEKETSVLCKFILLPLETILFVVFCVYLSSFNGLFCILPIIFWMVTAFKNKKSRLDFRQLAYAFLDDLYIKWLPLWVLFLLIFKDVNFLYVLGLHGFLFRNEVKVYIVSKFTSHK